MTGRTRAQFLWPLAGTLASQWQCGPVSAGPVLPGREANSQVRRFNRSDLGSAHNAYLEPFCVILTAPVGRKRVLIKRKPPATDSSARSALRNNISHLSLRLHAAARFIVVLKGFFSIKSLSNNFQHCKFPNLGDT